jgi:hypothetical protein
MDAEAKKMDAGAKIWAEDIRIMVAYLAPWTTTPGLGS